MYKSYDEQPTHINCPICSYAHDKSLECPNCGFPVKKADRKKWLEENNYGKVAIFGDPLINYLFHLPELEEMRKDLSNLSGQDANGFILDYYPEDSILQEAGNMIEGHFVILVDSDKKFNAVKNLMKYLNLYDKRKLIQIPSVKETTKVINDMLKDIENG